MTALFAKLQRRGVRIADRAAEKLLIRLEQQARDAVRGARIEREAGRIVLTGRGLARRWLTDPTLRFLGRSGR